MVHSQARLPVRFQRRLPKNSMPVRPIQLIPLPTRLLPLCCAGLLAFAAAAWAQGGAGDGSVLPGSDPAKPGSPVKPGTPVKPGLPVKPGTPVKPGAPTKPEGGKPEVGKPEGTKPEGNKPEGTKPEGGQSATPPSTLPGEDLGKAPAGQPKAGKSFLKFMVLRAGREPYSWLVPGRVVSTFVTNTATRLDLVMMASVPGHPEAAEEIQWEITPPAGFSAPSALLKGDRLLAALRRDGGNPLGSGAPLSLTVTARVTVDGQELRQSMTLTQDLRDRLRQEYVDFQRAYVPERRELLDASQYAARYGKKYPSVTFEELNFSRIPDTEDRYPFLLISERLVAAVHKIEREYGASLIISSGFRNPYRQLQVHSSVGESHHQYGRAADLYVAPDSAPPKTGRAIAWPADWLRLAAASLRGGGVWIEPMLACHVNTAGCHVHVDVRERGEASRVVQLAGQVLGPDGLPLPDVEVRLAGMPARTNASGNFLMKHVLTPRTYELEAEAPGRGVVTQSVEITPTVVPSVTVRFPQEPLASLVATAGALERNAQGEPVVAVTVRNQGTGAATNLRLVPRADAGEEEPAEEEGSRAASGAFTAPAPEAPGSGLIKRVWPLQPLTVQPGGEGRFRVALNLPPGLMMATGNDPQPALALTARYLGARGDERTQSLTVEWKVRPDPNALPGGFNAPGLNAPGLNAPGSMPELSLNGPGPAGDAAGDAPAASVRPGSRTPLRGPNTLPKDLAAGMVALTFGALMGLVALSVRRWVERPSPAPVVAVVPTVEAVSTPSPVVQPEPVAPVVAATHAQSEPVETAARAEAPSRPTPAVVE